jgi:putative acetyltransferase
MPALSAKGHGCVASQPKRPTQRPRRPARAILHRTCGIGQRHMNQIRPATTDADMDAVRQLCWDYRAHLCAVSPIEAGITETFYPVPKYTALMEGLAQTHARPQGIILLASQNGTPAGCGMSHALDATTSEIKRLFVAPQARGHGIAARLMEELTAQARADGFARLVLDTSVNLGPARALYTRLGFQSCPPYQPIPEAVLPHLVFFEKPL